MVSNQKLFSVGTFDFRLQHLLVIGVLALSVSISMSIRSAPLQYGSELFEFDPFYNFRATEYLVNNGSEAYFEWFDEKSWHPFGRNVSESSQVVLHFATAILYQIFGGDSTLYDFTILFPLVIGSLTSILVFAFVRVIGGTTAGLFAALIFSLSLPILLRGQAGWFKSEPLGLFFAFAAMYLFMSAIKFDKRKISAIKLIGAGLFLSLGLSAWGGILFFVLGLMIFYFIIPFIKHEKNFTIWAIPVFSISLIAFSSILERTSELVSYVTLMIILATVFVVVSEIIKKFSSDSKKIRNCIFFLIAIIGSGIGAFSAGFVNMPSSRYLSAANPFLSSEDALVSSVSEHTTTNIEMSFAFLLIFIVFSVIGAWFLFSKKSIDVKNDMRVFALIFSVIAIYFSSAFIRLEIFASVGVIILGSIGLAILVKYVLKSDKNYLVKFLFSGIIIILFTIPTIYPENNWTSYSDSPATILTGATVSTSSDDWIDATIWLKQNTSEDAVIAAWWDYGYWITALSDRATLVDNSTLIDWQIKKMGYVYMTSLENSWNILNSHYSTDISKYLGEDKIIAFGGTSTENHLLDLQTEIMFGECNTNCYDKLSDDNKYLVNKEIEQNGPPVCKQIFKAEAASLGIPEQSCNPITKGMDADYILIFLSGQRFFVTLENQDQEFYFLEGGGDELKKQWFAAISDYNPEKFIESDGATPKDYFMKNTTLGNLMPFSINTYFDPADQLIYNDYQFGRIAVYVKDLKLTDPENDPFYLVYASPSFYSDKPGDVSAVLIYKINSDFHL